MTEEKPNRPLPEAEGGAFNLAPKTVRPLEDIKVDADARLVEQARRSQAEDLDKQADRKERIDQHLIGNDFFGFKPTGDFDPYDPVVLEQLSTLLMNMEARRRKANPEFDITTEWDKAKTLKFFERKYVANQNLEKAADEDEENRDEYQKAIDTVRTNNPNIDNLALARELQDNFSADIPPEHLAHLQAFVRIQELAATPEDTATFAVCMPSVRGKGECKMNSVFRLCYGRFGYNLTIVTPLQ